MSQKDVFKKNLQPSFFSVALFGLFFFWILLTTFKVILLRGMLAYIFHHRSLAGFLFMDKIGLQSTWDGGRESSCWLQVNLSSKFCNTSPKISPRTFERQQWLNLVLQGSSIFSPALLQGAISCSDAKLPTSVHFPPSLPAQQSFCISCVSSVILFPSKSLSKLSLFLLCEVHLFV